VKRKGYNSETHAQLDHKLDYETSVIEKCRALLVMELTESGGIQIFRARLSWADVPGCFTEANSVRSWAHLGTTARAISFVVPPIARTPGLFKIAIEPQPRSVKVIGMRLFNHHRAVVWEWSPASPEGDAESSSQERPENVPLLQIGETVFDLSPDMKRLAPFVRGGTLEVKLACEGRAAAFPFSAHIDSDDSDRGASFAKLRRVEQEFAVVSQALDAVCSSKSWRWTEPLRNFLTSAKHARGVLRKYQRSVKQKVHSTVVPLQTPSLRDVGVVDVIVPIYRGVQETINCLESVMASQNRTPFELIVVNDCSPEPDLVAYVRALAGDGKFTLVEHEKNLGYTKSVNGGIELHPERDVVLLNSDTEVASDWLDRLVGAAYSSPNVGTVTPFSNNATLCSYPKPFAQNDLPPGCTTQSIDALVKELNQGQCVTIPTAVGFCMYVRRDTFKAVGLFDAQSFPGYGEENDFCLRAIAAGWLNLLAADTFVRHVGTVSFRGEGRSRQKAAWNMVRRLHPDYENIVARHAVEDPAKPYRDIVSVARLRQSSKPKIVFVVPDLHGGTERHVQDLARLLSGDCECLMACPDKSMWTLEWLNTGECLKLTYPNNEPGFRDLVGFLKSVPIQRAHVHHAKGALRRVAKLVEELSVPFDFSVHDFHAVCPQTFLADETHQFCGQPDKDGCNRCIAASSLPIGTVGTIEQWREEHMWLVTRSQRVFVPSRDAANRLRPYWPTIDFIVVPHVDQNSAADYFNQPNPPNPIGRAIANDEPLRIAVLGALSQEKGADILEECAIQAVELGLPLEFHLVGYAYHTLTPRPGANLVVNGAYFDHELQDILRQVRPHVVWFPARIPETFSYTLSAALESGLPVIASDLGAFAERLNGRQWSWVLPWNQTASQWNRLFVEMRESNFRTGKSPAPPAGHEPGYTKFSYGEDYLAPLRGGKSGGTTSSPNELSGLVGSRSGSVEALVNL